MIRVKLIAGSDSFQFQSSVNAFVSENKVIDIKFTSLLVNVHGGTAVCDRALVIYEYSEDGCEDIEDGDADG